MEAGAQHSVWIATVRAQIAGNGEAFIALFRVRNSGSPWVTLAILSCVGLMAMFADTMILPAIPDIIKDFKITYNTSSWILASFLITGAVMTPIAGRLSDMYGKKKMLLISMVSLAKKWVAKTWVRRWSKSVLILSQALLSFEKVALADSYYVWSASLPTPLL